MQDPLLRRPREWRSIMLPIYGNGAVGIANRPRPIDNVIQTYETELAADIDYDDGIKGYLLPKTKR